MQPNNGPRAVWIMVGILVVGLVSAPVAATQARIRVQCLSGVTLDGDRIRLGDVATVQGPDAGAVSRLRGIELAKAPLPGKSRGIDADYIKLRLRQHGVDLNRIDLQHAGPVVVTRRHIVVSKQQVARLVTAFIYKNSPWPREKMTIKRVRISGPVILPPGGFVHQVQLNPHEDLAGRVHLQVVFRSRSGLQRKVWATLEIEALTPVVVTRRMVARSAVITADDVRLIERDAAETPKDAASRLEDVIGMRAKRLMQAESLVTSGLIARPTLIKRGDVVRIIAKADGLQITAMGEARKKGSQGDRILVVNLDSKKVLQARVIDARTVQVDF